MSTADNYRTQRLKTMDGTRREATRRLWEMAREGVATRSRMGVNVLRYSTDLIPGTERVDLTCDLWGVEIEVRGASWGDVVTRHGEALSDPLVLRLDEAWLLTQTPEA